MTESVPLSDIIKHSPVERESHAWMAALRSEPGAPTTPQPHNYSPIMSASSTLQKMILSIIWRGTGVCGATKNLKQTHASGGPLSAVPVHEKQRGRLRTDICDQTYQQICHMGVLKPGNVRPSKEVANSISLLQRRSYYCHHECDS